MGALVLVADSDPFNLRLLSELCRSLGHDVATAAEGTQVLDAVARQCPDLLLMEANLPGTDGMQVLTILKADSRFSQVPVIVATTDGDADVRERLLAAGAQDYVSRPYRTFELQKRIRDAIRLGAIGDRPMRRMRRSPLTLDDAVSGAGTRVQLQISLDYEFTRAIRYQRPFSCVVVICENYVEIGEADGVNAAEAVMAPLSQALFACIRGVDHLYRPEPHEFTILLPETGDDGCKIVTERLHVLLADASTFSADLDPAPKLRVTAASYPSSGAADGVDLWRQAAAGR